MEPLLSLHGVFREFPVGESAVQALIDVDLDVFEGDYVAIVGPSGGGKSTLLSILGLLDSPSSGSYLVRGEDTAAISDRVRTALRSHTFGFVFQAFHLLESRPVRDSVELGVLYQGKPRDERQSAATDALDRLGIGTRASLPAKVLSGGQRQRVAIARAVATGNPVLLADEPTGNLDSVNGRAVLAELHRLHEGGTTIIVVTHSEEVARAASRVVRIIDGRLVEERKDGATALARAKRRALAQHAAGRLRGIDVFRDAKASLGSRRRDALVRMGSIALAVGLSIGTIGLSSSAGAQVSASFDARVNTEVTVSWTHDAVSPAGAVSVADSLPAITSASVLTDHGEVGVTNLGQTLSTSLQGVEGDLESSTLTTVTWATERRSLTSGQALIGSSLARQLELAPLAASPTISVNGTTFVIVGLVESSNRFPRLGGQLLVSGTDAQALSPSGRSTLAIVVVAGGAQQVGEQIAVALDPFEPSRFDVGVPIEPKDLRLEVEGGVQALLTAFTVLAGLAATAAISSSVSTSVRARTPEFGLRRAVGARAHHLSLLVTIESAVTGVLGGITGLALGTVGLLLFTTAQRWLPVFDWMMAPVAVASGLALAILGSLAGAVRAARIEPLAALRAS